ncbi:MAG: hypothetical protein KC543_07250 [Myxococcales bacterium]|nr:hypothetical protein [Myxococcales bacterium]
MEYQFRGSPQTIDQTLIQYSPGGLNALDELAAHELAPFPAFSYEYLDFLSYYSTGGGSGYQLQHNWWTANVDWNEDGTWGGIITRYLRRDPACRPQDMPPVWTNTDHNDLGEVESLGVPMGLPKSLIGSDPGYAEIYALNASAAQTSTDQGSGDVLDCVLEPRPSPTAPTSTAPRPSGFGQSAERKLEAIAGRTGEALGEWARATGVRPSDADALHQLAFLAAPAREASDPLTDRIERAAEWIAEKTGRTIDLSARPCELEPEAASALLDAARRAPADAPPTASTAASWLSRLAKSPRVRVCR